MIYLDVVTQHLAMSLGTSLAQTFASFASSSHGEVQLVAVELTPNLAIFNQKSLNVLKDDQEIEHHSKT